MIIGVTGYYQEKGSPKRIIKKDDSIKCPPDVPHWYGASKEEQLIQLAITDNRNGATVWMHTVTDEQYNK